MPAPIFANVFEAGGKQFAGHRYATREECLEQAEQFAHHQSMRERLHEYMPPPSPAVRLVARLRITRKESRT